MLKSTMMEHTASTETMHNTAINSATGQRWNLDINQEDLSLINIDPDPPNKWKMRHTQREGENIRQTRTKQRKK